MVTTYERIATNIASVIKLRQRIIGGNEGNGNLFS